MPQLDLALDLPTRGGAIDVPTPSVNHRVATDPPAPPSMADRMLLAAVAARDPGALAALFDRHAPAVLGLLVRMLGRHGEAEEVLQETFLWVWQNPLRYDPSRSSLRGWLLVIARSRALDVLRASRSRRLREIGVALEHPAAMAPMGLDGLEEAERRRRIAAALGGLPAEQRHCIELAFFAGLSHTQVAAHLGTPLGTVKSRIQLGMAKLRVALGRGGGLAAPASLAG